MQTGTPATKCSCQYLQTKRARSKSWLLRYPESPCAVNANGCKAPCVEVSLTPFSLADLGPNYTRGMCSLL
eukprot:1160012-Pelagomonas_calceolata.AAC.13